LGGKSEEHLTMGLTVNTMTAGGNDILHHGHGQGNDSINPNAQFDLDHTPAVHWISGRKFCYLTPHLSLLHHHHSNINKHSRHQHQTNDDAS